MHTLRMTNPKPVFHRRPGRATSIGPVLALGLGAVLAAAGCNAEPRDPPPPLQPAVAVPPSNREAAAAKMPHLAPPESDRIAYDAGARKLTFYALPAGSRWMILLPGATIAAPAGSEHHLPEGVDPDRTLVYYSQPGGLQSTPVTLKEIQAARDTHVSNNIR